MFDCFNSSHLILLLPVSALNVLKKKYFSPVLSGGLFQTMVFFSLPVGKEGVPVTLYMCSETTTYLAENQVYVWDTRAHIHVCWSIFNTEAVYRKRQNRLIIFYFLFFGES